MANAKYNMADKIAVENRKKAGAYLKDIRMKTEPRITQKQIADKLGIEYYTFISQVEAGASRLPPQHVADWAKICNASISEVGKTLLKYYDPHMFDAIFMSK